MFLSEDVPVLLEACSAILVLNVSTGEESENWHPESIWTYPGYAENQRRCSSSSKEKQTSHFYKVSIINI